MWFMWRASLSSSTGDHKLSTIESYRLDVIPASVGALPPYVEVLRSLDEQSLLPNTMRNETACLLPLWDLTNRQHSHES